MLLANSVQFELEIRTDVERSTGNTFLALVNSNNLRGMSVTVGLGKVITLSWFGNRSPNCYSTFPSCPICFAAGKWPVGGKKPKTNLDPKFQGMLGKCCVDPACHTYIITTDTAPNLNHLLFGQVVDNMQAVQKLAVDTTIFHAQAREMKVLPEYGLPAWMEACVEDGPGDAEHYHPPSPALK